jgi:hypothetical protein
MPKEYWLRSEKISRTHSLGRDANPRNVNVTSTKLGPRGGTREDQLLDVTDQRLQGASATGSQAVTSRRSRQADGMITLPAANATSVAKIGVTALSQVTHANRASSSEDASSHRWGRVPRRCPIESAAAEGSKRGSRMTPIIASLDSVTLEEALAYLESAEGDELVAAYSLAKDRNVLEGNEIDPDDAEVHHALFLLRRARGLNAPSFDLMRVQLRRLVAA